MSPHTPKVLSHAAWFPILRRLSCRDLRAVFSILFPNLTTTAIYRPGCPVLQVPSCCWKQSGPLERSRLLSGFGYFWGNHFLVHLHKKKVVRVFLHLDLYRTFWQCVVSERYQKFVLAPVDQSFEARSQNWISQRPMDSAKCNLNRFAGFRSEVIFRSHTRADLYWNYTKSIKSPASRLEWEKLHRGGLLPPGRCLLQVLTFHHWGDDQCQIYCCGVTRSYTADFIEIEWLDSGHWKYHTVSRFWSIGPDMIFVIPKIVYNNDMMWYNNISLLFWKL